VDGGYGCPTSDPIPSPEDIPDSGLVGDETIIVLQRGPTGGPSAPEEACFPGSKAHEAAVAGWDAVLFVQRYLGEGEGEDVAFCGSGAFVDKIVAVCATHEAFHKLFILPPFDPAHRSYPEDLAIGTIGERIEAGSIFDGWRYVHLSDRLFDAATLEDLSTFPIPEAHDPAFASASAM
jgi:hypothetical protein